MVNVFPLIFAIVLSNFLFYVTAVNKMFNLGAGDDVACYRVARKGGGGDEFPHRLVLGKIVSMQPFRLGRTAGIGVKPLPFTLNEPDLAASNFFIMTVITFPSNTQRSNSILCIGCIARVKGAPLDFFLSRLYLPDWTLIFFSFFF